jgi:CHAT domain-containing protein/tetratricopeptide (TPR) repeat protein
MERWRRTALAAERAWDERRVDAAVRLYRRAAEEAERARELVMLGMILHNLGLALDAAGDGQQARDVLFRARDLLSAAADGEQYLGAVLKTLGGIEVELGDNEAAISCHEAALELARTRGDDDAIVGSRVDLGIALKDAGRLSAAHDELTAALDLARARGLDLVTAHALTALGLVAEKLNRPAEAQQRYGAALPLYEKLADHGNAATVQYDLASLHDAAGNWDAAARLLDDAHARYLRVQDARGAADCRAALASIEIMRGNPARARELHEEAARLFRAGGYRRSLIDSLVDLAAIARDEGRLADAGPLLAEAGRLAAEIGDPLEIHDVELHQGDLAFTAGDEPAARAHYARSAEIMREQRERLTREDEALSFFGEDRTENIDRLIALSSADPGACVTWIERAKGQELLRRLDGTAVTNAPSWPDTQRLLERLAADDPARGVLFVHYYARDSVTVVAGMRPGHDPDLVPVEISLTELRAATASPGLIGWRETERLLRPLLAPIAAWAAAGDRVLLCPHDALHRFPLHAIEVEGQVLGERNVVSYVPSAGVLRHCLVRRAAGGGAAHRDAVILADASADRPLPLARDQARALEAMLVGRRWSVRCLAGPDATLRALEGSAEVGLAHFAVHGFSAPDGGLDSGLRLADGTLTARRLLGLRFDGALVCLAACDTGLGERRAGDELLGLVRSALQAGAGSVLASLWPVDQVSSSMLLLDFHQRLLDGEAKADALRAAQLRLRDASVADVLAHLAQTRQRQAGDPRTLAAAALAEAGFLLAAGDAANAMAAVAGLLARAGGDDAETRQAEELRERARLVARQPRNPNYARRPFRGAEHWAPFILIGDPV